MLRIRLILAWLLLAALPLQGWAAATMLFCGPAPRAAVVAKAHSPEAAANHHQMHGPHDVPAAHAQHHDAADGAQPVADGSHTCGVCAACCHGVALAQTQPWPSVSPAPEAGHGEPLLAVLARPSPVPDKPPRA